MAVTLVSDIIVPELFTPYTQQLTQEKSRLIQSGALVSDPFLNNFLAGGGLTINAPSYQDLADDADNVSSDSGGSSTPNKIETSQEIAVRLSRNNSWSTADLSGDLAGADPSGAIASRVSNYWMRRLQAVFVATLTGIFADNAAAPSGTEHVQNDMTHDISGSAYTPGVTDFSAEAFIDTSQTMGDSQDELSLAMMHSVVYSRMKKNNLIDFIPDARGETRIATFLDHEVIVDDSMPSTGGVFETWMFGVGAVRLGTGSPKTPTETDRTPAAGNGGGTETLFNRVEWSLHPAGNQYAGTAAVGGPSNASTTNNLANAGSWLRVFPERKQIQIARLITRES